MDAFNKIVDPPQPQNNPWLRFLHDIRMCIRVHRGAQYVGKEVTNPSGLMKNFTHREVLNNARYVKIASV